MTTQPRPPFGGTHGKILHVDLTSGQLRIETPDDYIYRTLIGGRALIAYLLLRDLPPGTDPLGPENRLIFAPGILQGTHLPGSGRHGVGAKSPLTGALGSSEAGGWWGTEFKGTGFDALVIRGRAAQPVYLWIKDGEVEMRPAEHLWGKETAEVAALLHEELGDHKVRIAQIGIAGENQVRFAAIMHDINRAAGRNGLGAVMGSKNLKAVVVRGTQPPSVVDRKRIVTVARWLGQNYKVDAAWAVKMGTPAGVSSLGLISALPTRNFQHHAFPGREKISGELMHETILKGRDTCMVCPIACKQVVAHEDADEYSLAPVYGGPEYETLAALGSDCGVDNLLAVAKANERCAAYGLDTISAGATIAFVMECVDRGLLTADATGGYLPRWGDARAMLAGVELIARREGFGDKMAEGVARLAADIGNGAEAFALHVKGQELPMHEPRLKAAMGLGYAVAPVGADHMMNIHDTDFASPGYRLQRVNSVYKVGPLPPDDLGEEKMNLFYHEVNWMHALDCCLICMFHPYRYEHVAEALSGATGVEYSIEDVLAVGERAQTLSRLFNYRQGFTAADDRLPGRVMKAFNTGPLAGIEITPASFDWALHRFYELMGWDRETGTPLPERIEALGLTKLLAEMRHRDHVLGLGE
ncbi:MAG: aldehyde ferredoxin oxidoreductase family protein [Chloroflexi bacterium]|nr:aldehyde ferredoxin oxidoreductase family protein [Chloroflexota bacterium]